MKNAFITVLVSGIVLFLLVYAAFSIEKANHNTTKEQLKNAMQEVKIWQALANSVNPQVLALQTQVKECLARENTARVASKEREEILRQSIIQERTQEEKQEVVDNATREKAILRLNRPL